MSDKNVILRIDSSVRGTDSVSRTLSGYLTEELRLRDGGTVVQRDLGRTPFPPVTAEQLRTIHGSLKPTSAESHAQLDLSNQLVDELRSTRSLVIGAPMYNFGIAPSLKVWIDHICRAGETFRYSENGPQGLSGIRHGFIVVASGGTPIGSDYDFVSGYLKQVLGFIGVENIHVISADGSKHDAREIISRGREQVDAVLASIFEEAAAI